MKVRPMIAESGKSRWNLGPIDYQNPQNNVMVEYIFHLYAPPLPTTIHFLDKLLKRADFDWMYVHNEMVRIDADAAQRSAEFYQYVPWFLGLLEVKPVIYPDPNGDTYLHLIIEKKALRRLTVRGGKFSIHPHGSNYRRLIAWIPLTASISWSGYSFFLYFSMNTESTLFAASGALLAVSGGWIDLWLWLWQKDLDKQPIQPREFKWSMVIGYMFVALGSIIWAYGDLL